MILYRPHTQRGRRGFTLIELLCATLVMAIVMAATAIAVNSATQAYTGNKDQASVNQVARVLMDHIARGIRGTEDVVLYSNGIKLINPAGSTVSEAIYYTSANQQCLYRTLAAGTTTNTVLLGSEQGFFITNIETEAHYDNVWITNAAGVDVSVSRPLLVSVELSFRLVGQTNVQTINISSCPRMNQNHP
jgi:prepilin-type N-terminal cleavage/methylation domain-containing protein